MSTHDFIIDLVCRVNAALDDSPKHPQAHWYPSELAPVAVLFALKGVGPRACYRWLIDDVRSLFPPSRNRHASFAWSLPIRTGLSLS